MGPSGGLHVARAQLVIVLMMPPAGGKQLSPFPLLFSAGYYSTFIRDRFPDPVYLGVINAFLSPFWTMLCYCFFPLSLLFLFSQALTTWRREEKVVCTSFFCVSSLSEKAASFASRGENAVNWRHLRLFPPLRRGSTVDVLLKI